jgi:site-specific DNA-methyltransferase (adenine-specific)
MKEINKLYQGDCLEVMDKLIDEGVKVDAIITDPPYGTTACKWDSVIPFDEMWQRLNKLIKPNGAIVLFGSEPFSSALRMSNIKNYKYDWVWDKGRGYNFASLKYCPFKSHEIISVFSKKAHNYFPQKTKGRPYSQKQGRKGEVYGGDNGREIITINNGDRHPLSIQKFVRGRDDVGLHPTQKPVALMEYLIKTYTNENETVLDFAMGSGSTGVACVNTGRNFIGIEIDETYFNIAKKRIEEAEKSAME